jgi:hypothetical protein
MEHSTAMLKMKKIQAYLTNPFHIIYKICLSFSLLFISGLSLAQIQIYPSPKNAIESNIFQLSTDGERIMVMKYMDYHYSHFAFSGKITIEVTVLEEITNYSISPKSLCITGNCTGNKLTFSISQIESNDETPFYLVIQINSLPKLVILGDRPENNIPSSKGMGIFNVTKAPYNADSTGNIFAQPAIQSAIDDASKAGGGIVYVPYGIYKVKENLSVKSNVKLYLAPGSVLKAIEDRNKYDMKSTINPLLIMESEEAAIYGRGEIDGSGFVLMNPTKGFCTQSEKHPRRRVIRTDNGKNISIKGIIVKDGSGWTIELMRSDSVRIQSVKVLNHKDITYKIQNDGINSVSSSNTLVNQCFVMTIDDAMCAKARYGDMENCLFTNNIVFNWAAGVKAGMQSVGKMENIIFRNIDIIQSRRGIGIDTREGSKPISDVKFYNIRIEELQSTRHGNPCCIGFVASEAPILDIKVSNISCPTNNKIILEGAFDITNIVFEGLELKGKLITSESQVDFLKGSGINVSYEFK